MARSVGFAPRSRQPTNHDEVARLRSLRELSGSRIEPELRSQSERSSRNRGQVTLHIQSSFCTGVNNAKGWPLSERLFPASRTHEIAARTWADSRHSRARSCGSSGGSG